MGTEPVYKNTMDLSIIIISYNTKDLLDHCLESVFSSLKKSTLQYEVLVVDNASTDGSVDMMKRKYPRVICMVNKENKGYGKANNDAIRRAAGERILLLNSDTIVVSDALVRLYEFSLRHPKAFVAPKLLNRDRSEQMSCGPFMTLPVAFAILFLKGDALHITRWSPSKVTRVDWASGAALMARRLSFLDDLLFDEKIFMYMDEIDLLYRAKQKGYPTFFVPSAKIVHIGSGSSKKGKRGPIIQIYKGFLYFYKKHYGKKSLAVLKVLLRFKAFLGMIIGIGLRNKDMKETYEEAYKLV